MRLSWNEIRSRAGVFAQEWAGEGYEKGQTQLFYRDFFEVFGVPVRRVASFEEPVKNLGNKRGFIDLFWKGVLLVEQKSAGIDLKKAKQQALNYFPGLKDAELPRYILLSDFQTFELYDLEEDEETKFALKDLPKHVEKLGFILGLQKRTFKDQDPVNIKASELVGKLHDALEDAGYVGHDLEQFLVRIVFCLFADDTGIFETRDLFLDLLETRTNEDGSDLGGWLAQLFQVLDTPEDKRAKNLDVDLAKFPYVNGALFSGGLLIPSFDRDMRKRLLEACRFDWSGISPAIFGSLFQSVMNKKERRAAGAHYTTEKNILKVIQPLFLDQLRSDFARIKARKDNRRRGELLAFQKQLKELRIFDPACGCGNFLIIAYRELRTLEIELIRELRNYQAPGGQQELDATELSVVNVDQFYGIEVGEFPAKIAETAMWMMDHIMNSRLSLEFGQTYVRIPLKKSPHILFGDALDEDWESLLPAAKCSYVLGNPPFIGAKYQKPKQRTQVREIAKLGRSGGTLDYVAAWFIKAANYIKGTKARIGFVSTNSITQGEQVAQLWPLVLDQCKLDISFAHRTFAWGSDARGQAHVHVVIVGLANKVDTPKERRLFSYLDIHGEPAESVHTVISPYLFDAGGLSNPHLVVRETSRPMNGLPKIVIGSKPIDGGYYILSEDEKAELLKSEPKAESFIHPFVGSREFLHGTERFILYLGEAAPAAIDKLPLVKAAIANVRDYRLGKLPPKGKGEDDVKEPGISSRALADTPRSFHVTVVPKSAFLVVPEVSSERREYIPIAWLEPPIIPSNKVRIMPDAAHWQFGILMSAMHMAWTRCVGGRLESRYQYSIGINYNAFPMPPVGAAALLKLEPLVGDVLAERDKHAGSSLAQLYDPDLMPPELKKAHRALDKAVDRLYRAKKFDGDRDRAEHLFELYEKMVAPVIAKASEPPRRKSKASAG
ncbi:class I SAM-dependent DNA methyltransferase [Rhizobium leguminosarum]|uniref:site-specific DNA-methyltransferase (adenine-specific) n=1 Tax=Rhizobium beringeri TaxID=3019934 RepID=A0ABY1XGY8_9HYPH|nr:class I SAM-dependent DNA methyltransferase [Rhizobium leguminosarum]TBE57571.1 class I SAM-dependent DNA methyltransferase [Rhizobium beringeri]